MLDSVSPPLSLSLSLSLSHSHTHMKSTVFSGSWQQPHIFSTSPTPSWPRLAWELELCGLAVMQSVVHVGFKS